MATTTNFGWETPDNTDAVTNGALAIRTLAGEIDATVYGNLNATFATQNPQTFFPCATFSNGSVDARSDTLNSVLLIPFKPARTIALTSISINVTTAATASCYLGIYSDNGGVPNALITDFGSVSTSTTGIKTIAIGQTVTGGVQYWLAVKPNSTTSRFTSAIYDTNLMAPSIGTIASLMGTIRPFGLEAANASSGALSALSSIDADPDAGVMIVLEA